ncbi:MAG: hypothetical protein PUG90_01140 [Clostridia bacterium]|nr:hypothetical protein [Clostridia bacterium]MDY4083000.1 hypothetical protein [Eubacteriales bacterium]
MKNFSKVAVIVCLALALVLCAVACQPDMPSKGEVTIVIAPLEGEATEYTVDLSDIAEGGGVVAILDYLQANKGLKYTSEDRGYGAYLTKVGVLEEKPEAGEFIYLYTSVAKDFNVSEYASTVEYQGKTLTDSGVGVSSMSVEDGAIIYITIIKFNY